MKVLRSVVEKEAQATKTLLTIENLALSLNFQETMETLQIGRLDIVSKVNDKYYLSENRLEEMKE